MNLKFAIGLVLGFAIGFGCYAAGIPSPAPPALAGTFLVIAMTTGHVLADRYLAGKVSSQAENCEGSSDGSFDRLNEDEAS